MKLLKQIIYVLIIIITPYSAAAYDLPYVNLGLANILDGGPLRANPGLYFQEYFPYYYSRTFLDAQGKLLGGIPSPQLNNLASVTQLIYIFNQRLLGARPGIDVSLPAAIVTDISTNKLGITSNGSGLGDVALGFFLQWNTIFKGTRPIYVQRIEFNISLPSGKYSTIPEIINPGNGFFFISPYWAATLYFTPKLGFSWRLNYLWCAENKKTKRKAGTATYLNYAFEYRLQPRLFIALNGYWLEQLTPTQQNGHKVPDSYERVAALGPGILYSFDATLETVVFANFFAEFNVRNRTQGIKTVFRFLKHF